MNATKPFKILLMADNPADARLVREAFSKSILRKDAVQLECVERLADGLERLKKGDVDVVYLDLCLPDCCGIETLHKVLAQHPEVPVTVLSGIDDENVKVKALDAGAVDYMVKGKWLQNTELLGSKRD